MYDGRTKLAEQVAEEVRGHFGDKVCKQMVPRSVRFVGGALVRSTDHDLRSFVSGRRCVPSVAKEVAGDE
jgi:cellulose biosynthesis protein BcsQ